MTRRWTKNTKALVLTGLLSLLCACDGAEDTIGRPMNSAGVYITKLAEAPNLAYQLDVYVYTDETNPKVHSTLAIFDHGTDSSTAVLSLEAAAPTGSFSGWWESFREIPTSTNSKAQACVFDDQEKRSCVAPLLRIDWVAEGPGNLDSNVATFDSKSDSAKVPAISFTKEIMRYVWDNGEVPEDANPSMSRDDIPYPL